MARSTGFSVAVQMKVAPSYEVKHLAYVYTRGFGSGAYFRIFSDTFKHIFLTSLCSPHPLILFPPLRQASSFTAGAFEGDPGTLTFSGAETVSIFRVVGLK